MVILDRSLVTSLERAEVSSWSAYLSGFSGDSCTASIQQFGNTYALKATGVRSQMINRVKNFSDIDLEHFDAILAYYRDTNTSFVFDIVPDLINSPKALYEKLLDIGATPTIHYTQHIFNLHRQELPVLSLDTNIISSPNITVFADTYVRGFGVNEKRQQQVRPMQELGWSSSDLHKYLVLDGTTKQPCATGVVHYSDEKIALLSGATTIPEHRGKGFQQQLIRYRLLRANDHDMDYAISDAVTGSTSSRNLQRQGFHVAYTRTCWQVIFD